MTLPRTPVHIVVALVVLLPVTTRAQGPPAREYLNTPVYAARIFADFISSSGETAAASEVPLPNNEMIVRNGIVSLLYSFPLGDKYGGVGLTGGYARVKINRPLRKLSPYRQRSPRLVRLQFRRERRSESLGVHTDFQFGHHAGQRRVMDRPVRRRAFLYEQ